MQTDIHISDDVYRSFILGKQGLWPARRWSGLSGTAQAIRAIEAVQVDPVSVSARSHDIVLWGRVAGYQPEFLDTLLYKEHQFFDYGGTLFIYPIEELPYWRVIMNRFRTSARWLEFSQEHPELIDTVRQSFARQSPLRSRDVEGNKTLHYRSSKDSGVSMYYLWRLGELMTHHRSGIERYYDLLEKVAPAHLQWTATEDQSVDFFLKKEISQYGMVNSRTFRSIYKNLTNRPVETHAVHEKLAYLVESGLLATVAVENQKEILYSLAEDTRLIHELSIGKLPPEWRPVEQDAGREVIFLSPLDYVSARGRAKNLFKFDYTWEIYKPASIRRYGSYTLPVLYGNRLVARIDLKMERSKRLLVVNGFWLEDWFELDQDFAQAFGKGLASFMMFLQAENSDLAAIQPESLRKALVKFLE
jgi:uncharacterized protein YcaQ